MSQGVEALDDVATNEDRSTTFALSGSAQEKRSQLKDLAIIRTDIAHTEDLCQTYCQIIFQSRLQLPFFVVTLQCYMRKLS